MTTVHLQLLSLWDTSNEVYISTFMSWMFENIGERGIDWDWNLNSIWDISVRVKDPEKATLVALRWSGK
jgi:hypothetical protein